jgi:hypothetical protein
VVQHLPSKCESLSSHDSPTQKKKKEEEEEKEALTYWLGLTTDHVLLSCSFVFIFLTYQLDSKGCITHRQNTSVFQLMQIHQQTITTLQVNAKITEEGTGTWIP